ncbi:hypothetical protein [Arthrobacter sp. StoSoilB13]|uniref:hypothetical protein n=1 Tax=Arthrobacter sp. StoSoilB13 TaxID=2830993 RepID=UPI001CC3A74A|nr:hypothetical protein [Arthrobacter sp. StoSoilB13]
MASVAAFVLVGAGTFIFLKASETESVLSANRTEAAAHTPAPITAPPTSAPPKLNGVSTALKNATEAFVIGVLGDSTGNGP